MYDNGSAILCIPRPGLQGLPLTSLGTGLPTAWQEARTSARMTVTAASSRSARSIPLPSAADRQALRPLKRAPRLHAIARHTSRHLPPPCFLSGARALRTGPVVASRQALSDLRPGQVLIFG